MLTLMEFLTARLNEDEAAAQAASPAPWNYYGIDSVSGGMFYDKTRTIGGVYYEQLGDHDGTIVRHLLEPEANANGRHIARHDPARVLAEVAAKRTIVDLHPYYEGWCTGCELNCKCDLDDDCTCDIWRAHPCPTLRIMAAVHASHPDYRQEWSP